VTGANGGEALDLQVLAALGVRVAGRLEGFDGARALFAGDLAASCASADRRLAQLLERIDAHIDASTGDPGPAPEPWPDRLRLPAAPRELDLAAAGVRTVIWATGYRRDYPWLRVPVRDRDGEIAQRRGVTPSPGLYTLGLKFQWRRNSHFIGGVGADAAYVARRILAEPTALPQAA
jgi:putative flavoprotein involved in K+ transport